MMESVELWGKILSPVPKKSLRMRLTPAMLVTVGGRYLRNLSLPRGWWMPRNPRIPLNHRSEPLLFPGPNDHEEYCCWIVILRRVSQLETAGVTTIEYLGFHSQLAAAENGWLSPDGPKCAWHEILRLYSESWANKSTCWQGKKMHHNNIPISDQNNSIGTLKPSDPTQTSY